MEHPDTAHLAALVGALGAVLVLLASGRNALLSGLALLAGAEAALGIAITGGHVPRSPAAVGLLGLGFVFVLLAAAAFVRFPGLVSPLLLAASPFRLPLDFARGHRFFLAVADPGQLGRLLPLYAVLAAATLALAWTAWRRGTVQALPRVISLPSAAFFALTAVSLLWSHDLVAGENALAFFLLPFAALLAVVGRAAFRPWTPRALAAVGVALGVVFATIGLWQAATHKLLFFSRGLEVENSLTTFFRVTSLFRDPSLYGRHLVLAITVLLVAVLLRRVHLLVAAPLIALLWAGLYFSYSQSSFAALFVVTLAVAALAGDRPMRPTVAVAALVIALVGSGLVAASIGDSSVRRATGDRPRRVELTARVFAEHPIAGVGLGGQPVASKKLSKRGGATTRFVSHATPLTVAAELGLLGLAVYLWLIGGAVLLVNMVRRLEPALGLTLGAVLLALFVHALLYSGFFEDPVTWVVVGVGSSFLLARAGTAGAGAILSRSSESARSQ